jgi:hypothetical protein
LAEGRTLAGLSTVEKMENSMYLRKMIVCGLGAACFFLNGVARAADSVMVRPKHTPGEKCYLEVDQQITQKITGGQAPGGGMTFKVHRLYGLMLTVDKATPDNTQLTMTFDRVSQKIDGGAMMNASFDSDDPDNEESAKELGEALSPMLGLPLKFQLDKDNHFTSATGMKEIKAFMSSKAGNNMFLRQLGQELTDERAKMMYGENRYVLYANKEVKVGDHWKRQLTDNIPRIGKVVSEYDCKLDRITEEEGRKVAVVSFESTTKSADRPAGETQSAEPQLSMNGTYSGTGTFDIEKGVITKSVSEGNAKLKSVPSGGGDTGDSAPSINIELMLKTTTTVMPEAERGKQKAEAKKKADAAKGEADARKAARKKAREERKAKKKTESGEDNGDQKEKDDKSEKNDE